MDRLTWEYKDGGMFVDGNEVKNYIVDDVSVCTGNAIIKLAQYEDTGLTPEEIHDFVIWLNEDREELNDLTLFNDIGELARYRETGLTPERIVELNTFEKTQCAKLLEENCKLKQEVEYWKREAIKWADKLGEIRVYAADSLCDK